MRFLRDVREGWRVLCESYAAALRDGWVRYEAEWHRDTEPGYPMGKTDQQRKALALAMADFLEALGGKR